MRHLRRLRIHLLVGAGLALLLLGAHAVIAATSRPAHAPVAGVAATRIPVRPGPAHGTPSARPGVPPARGRNFSITATLDRALYPGTTGRLNLAITAPKGHTLHVTSLSVTVRGSSKPACAATNFALTQYSGRYPLVVPGGTTRSLQQLGVPTQAWPSVTLRDLPVNQDACKNVTVALAYSGTGQGS